jgi:hypothetical protein
MILEGTLVEPYLGELREAFRAASEALEGRKLVVDLTDVTVISCEAESTLSELMQQGAKFSCGGVLIKHMLKKLARRCHGSQGRVVRPAASSND